MTTDEAELLRRAAESAADLIRAERPIRTKEDDDNGDDE